MLALGQRPVVGLWDKEDDERHIRMEKNQPYIQRDETSTEAANKVSLKHAKELRGAATLMQEEGYKLPPKWRDDIVEGLVLLGSHKAKGYEFPEERWQKPWKEAYLEALESVGIGQEGI